MQDFDSDDEEFIIQSEKTLDQSNKLEFFSTEFV